ncbi:unnamed protein product [Cylicocyclus nassatus]|uniref:Uncharacterized protein n=1 Tax=Cylicocyclus nassatus TaxID=53992 RepID=A0AA36GZB4_CYLNA|nr:unnamed protein product [Cylicocyclus nassatus]
MEQRENIYRSYFFYIGAFAPISHLTPTHLYGRTSLLSGRRISKRRDLLESNNIPTTVHSSRYCIAYNITKASRSFREDNLEPITLAIHSTSLYLHLLDEQIQSWDGPVSLAFFIDRGSASAVQYLLDLYRCRDEYRAKLSLHVVYKLSAFQERCYPLPLMSQSMPCKNLTKRYRKRFLENLLPPFGIYPINVMRNVARRGAPSLIHLISDIEMVFSLNFAENAKKIANEHIKEGAKKLIVIRRFEIKENATVPRNHTSLKELIDDKIAFEYHHKLFPLGHTIEALWEWFRRSKSQPEPYVWEIPYKNPAWEPQFIMHATDPMSEEGMPTRHRDQQALAYELCRANYTFLLASQLFNVHRGIKTVTTSMDSAVVQHQTRLRYRAFKKFVHRIDRMYPKTIRRCKRFVM